MPVFLGFTILCLSIWGGLFWMVRKIKKLSQDGKLSSYYLRTEKPEEFKGFQKLDIAFTTFLKSCGIAVAAVIIAILVVSIGEYKRNVLNRFFSSISWDTWFNTLFVGISLPTILATFGITYLLKERTANHFVFYTIDDWLNRKKVVEKLVLAALLQALGLLEMLLCYCSRFQTDVALRSILLQFFGLSATLVLFGSLAIFLGILWTTVLFSLGRASRTGLLEESYKRVQQWPREPNEKITIKNKHWIRKNLNHMINSVQNVKPVEDLSKKDFSFTSFMDKVDDPTAIPRVLWRKMLFLVFGMLELLTAVIPVGIVCAYCNPFEDASSRYWLLFSFVVGTVLCIVITLILRRVSSDFRQMVAYFCLGAWGFASTGDVPKFFSASKNPMLDKALCNTIRSYYCVVSAFRDAVASELDAAELVLDLICENAADKGKNVALYCTCVFLYYKSKEGAPGKYIKEIENVVNKAKLDVDLLERQTCALLYDILRRDPSEEVHAFFEIAMDTGKIKPHQKVCPKRVKRGTSISAKIKITSRSIN